MTQLRAPKNSVEVLGWRDLERRVGRLPGSAFRAAEPLLERAARRSQSVARQLFASQVSGYGSGRRSRTAKRKYKGGLLKRGIRAKRYGTMVVLVARAPHSHFFERGTDPAPGKPGRQPARAYLYPAADIVGSSLLPALYAAVGHRMEADWNRP